MLMYVLYVLAGVPVGGKSSVCLICMKYRIIILIIIIKDEIEGKQTSLLAQMYDRNRILVMLPIMWLNIS